MTIAVAGFLLVSGCGDEDASTWDDADKRLGPWRDAFMGPTPNPSGRFE